LRKFGEINADDSIEYTRRNQLITYHDTLPLLGRSLHLHLRYHEGQKIVLVPVPIAESASPLVSLYVGLCIAEPLPSTPAAWGDSGHASSLPLLTLTVTDYYIARPRAHRYTLTIAQLYRYSFFQTRRLHTLCRCRLRPTSAGHDEPEIQVQQAR
jgi:hypothetical protein